MQIPLEITRSFVENHDGTFDLCDCPHVDNIGDTLKAKNQTPIRPAELKTFLKVGRWFANRSLFDLLWHHCRHVSAHQSNWLHFYTVTCSCLPETPCMTLYTAGVVTTNYSVISYSVSEGQVLEWKR